MSYRKRRRHTKVQTRKLTRRLLNLLGKILKETRTLERENAGAESLCVTLHYLSEICRKACGIPVTYWIDRFTLHEIANLLCQKELPLSEIAAGMNFSSFSYFSRYVSRHFGISHTMSTGSH